MNKSHQGIPARRYKEEKITNSREKRFLSEEEEVKDNRSSSVFSIENNQLAMGEEKR